MSRHAAREDQSDLLEVRFRRVFGVLPLEDCAPKQEKQRLPGRVPHACFIWKEPNRMGREHRGGDF